MGWNCLYFEWEHIRSPKKNPALQFIQNRMGDWEMFADPIVRLHWHDGDDEGDRSTVHAMFQWMTPGDIEDMTLEVLVAQYGRMQSALDCLANLIEEVVHVKAVFI